MTFFISVHSLSVVHLFEKSHNSCAVIFTSIASYKVLSTPENIVTFPYVHQITICDFGFNKGYVGQYSMIQSKSNFGQNQANFGHFPGKYLGQNPRNDFLCDKILKNTFRTHSGTKFRTISACPQKNL